MKQPGTYFIHYAGRREVGRPTRPASALVVNGVLAYFGDPDDIEPDLKAFVDQAQVIDKRDRLVLPAMVNAHTHLELTDIGPQPYDSAGGFVGWVKQLRALEPGGDEALVTSAQRGAQMCLDAGVQAVGDITRSLEVSQATQAAGLWGYSYRELFGLGPPFDQTALQVLESLRESEIEGDHHARFPLRLGAQPHATYSAGPSVFEAASGPTRRACTHLAETREEAEFVGALSGPLYDYVRSLGRWDDRFADQYGQGLSPVQWMRPYFEAGYHTGSWFSNWLVAHCNYVDDDDIQLLAECKINVAYCPIASEYFGHKDHRYRDMLAAGINVCLGTDSIVCADPSDPQPLGVMGAMRRLYQRDKTDPDTLLKMATENGALALMIDPKRMDVATGHIVTIEIDPDSSVDPLVQALKNDTPLETMVYDSPPGSDERVLDGSPRQHWLRRLRHHGRADGEEPA